jgi:hypothetical protein
MMHHGSGREGAVRIICLLYLVAGVLGQSYVIMRPSAPKEDGQGLRLRLCLVCVCIVTRYTLHAEGQRFVTYQRSRAVLVCMLGLVPGCSNEKSRGG